MTTSKSTKSNRNIDYSCSVCGREVGRENLRVKRAVFMDMGSRGSTVRSRTTAWLCIIPKSNGAPSCCELDVDWNAEKYANSPGMADTHLAQEAQR